MMNQEDLFKKIGHILSELQEQYQYIAEHPQNLNGLEVELMLSNANFLTDHIQIVRKTLNHQETKALPQHTESSPEQIQRVSSNEIVPKDLPLQNKFEFEEKQVDQLFNRALTPEEQAIIAKKQQLNKPVEIVPEAVFILPEPEVEKEPEPVTPIIEERPDVIEITPVEETPPLVIPTAPVVETSIAEKPVKPTLNELLANNMQTTEKADHPASEIKDLKQAISLNDKLVFVKDLFHGYNLAYAEVIDLLNKMPDYKSADTFLQHNYAVKNDWKNKQATVERFYQLLKRRFPAK
ncbi:hypothetical protein IWX76_002186 [Pedobacter sp. CAN_A7]|uniref:hypothetical protein n=1 Tax=Pedobacter sp. CAN_A7 TaxID=2787722 RepID=UPI0018CA7F87